MSQFLIIFLFVFHWVKYPLIPVFKNVLFLVLGFLICFDIFFPEKTYSVKAEINHHPPPQDHLTPNGITSVPQDGAVRRMLALYDYDPQELSPNVDAEVSFLSAYT